MPELLPNTPTQKPIEKATLIKPSKANELVKTINDELNKETPEISIDEIVLANQMTKTLEEPSPHHYYFTSSLTVKYIKLLNDKQETIPIALNQTIQIHPGESLTVQLGELMVKETDLTPNFFFSESPRWGKKLPTGTGTYLIYTQKPVTYKSSYYKATTIEAGTIFPVMVRRYNKSISMNFLNTSSPGYRLPLISREDKDGPDAWMTNPLYKDLLISQMPVTSFLTPPQEGELLANDNELDQKLKLIQLQDILATLQKIKNPTDSVKTAIKDTENQITLLKKTPPPVTTTPKTFSKKQSSTKTTNTDMDDILI